MNLSWRTKCEIVSQRKEIMQKRVLTGKKVKLTPEEKNEEIKKAQQKRDDFEDAHLGGFERIFPIDVRNYLQSYCTVTSHLIGY